MSLNNVRLKNKCLLFIYRMILISSSLMVINIVWLKSIYATDQVVRVAMAAESSSYSIKDDKVATYAENTKDGKNSSLYQAIQMARAIMCLLLLTTCFYLILIRHRELKKEKNKLAILNDKLKEKEEIFRALYEQSPVGIAFGDFNDDTKDMNVMFEKIVGRNKEELANLHWSSYTHPDDIQEDIENFKKLKNKEIEHYSMIKRYIKPDGSIVWANMKISPLNIDNSKNLTNICIVEDITERIQAEKNLMESERNVEMLLSNLQGMVYRGNYDNHFTMQFVSEGCFDLTGYKQESLLNNKEISFNDLITPEYKDYIMDKWIEVINNNSSFKEEYSIITANNELKWVYEQGQCVYNENGDIIGIEGLIIDISDRKKREDEIKFLYYHDVLTGLYNRRFFEEEKKRYNSEEQLPLSIIIGDINGLKLINDALGHDEGDKLIVHMAKILKRCSREGDILARTGGDEFSILLPKTNNQEANKIVKLIGEICEEYRQKTKDETYHISISLGCATMENTEETISSIIKDAEDGMHRHKLLQTKSLHSTIIASMKTTLFEKSQETEEHAQRLINLSKAMGQRLNLVEEKLNELELLSTLHDIGKIGINDSILNKPGKLTEKEWVIMKKHPEIGYRIAMSSPELAPVAEYILCHHERWDGTGYPQGLKGKDIPLLSRIISIADSYDAMTEDRSYRKAMSKEEALEEIRLNAGTQFDPELVKVFMEYISKNL